MKFIRIFAAIMAIIASDTAFAADFDVLESKEIITTTKTIERETDDGELEPVEKEVTTETLIDIPAPEKPTEAPCVVPSDEFIENNSDDDSDIISEVEGQLLINEKGEIGYALDEVPAELLKDNPIYADQNLAPKDLAAEQAEREIEADIDAALDDIDAEGK